MEKENKELNKQIWGLKNKFIEQQMMYQEWFKEIREELEELRKYCQEDAIKIDRLENGKRK